MSCGIVRPPVWQVFSEIVYRNCERISWCQNLVTGDWRRRALQMFPPDESHVRKPSHNLSKRLTLLCPDLFISPPLSCSPTHPQRHPHTRAHPPPSVIHPPPSTSVANTKGVEAYKRVRGFRGRAEETSNLLSSCHQLHSTFFFPTVLLWISG